MSGIYEHYDEILKENLEMLDQLKELKELKEPTELFMVFYDDEDHGITQPSFVCNSHEELHRYFAHESAGELRNNPHDPFLAKYRFIPGTNPNYPDELYVEMAQVHDDPDDWHFCEYYEIHTCTLNLI